MPTNQAAFLDRAGSQLQVREAPMPQAEPNRIVIHNKVLAINPADWKIRDQPYFIKELPIVLGGDAAGDVIEVGEGVTRFQAGDRVASYAHLLFLFGAPDADA